LSIIILNRTVLVTGRSQQTNKLNSQIIIDDETKEAFMSKVQSEGKTASELIMGWIRSYIAEERQEGPDLS